MTVRAVTGRENKRCDWIGWGITLVLDCGHRVHKSGINKQNAERHKAFWQTKIKCAQCAAEAKA